VLPELVSTDANGYKSVAYVNVVPVLVEALKAEHARVNRLEAQVQEIETLQGPTDGLTARLMQSEAERPTRK